MSITGHSPLLNSLETRADGTPSLSQIEALRPIRRCATDAAVIGIAIFGVCGLVPWHLRDPDRSMCVCRLYLRRLKLHGQNHTKCTQFGPCKKIVFHRLCFLKPEY